MIITCIVVPWRHLLSKWHWQSTLTILLTTWMHVQKCGYCLFNFSAGVTVCILDLILFYMGNRNRFETKGNLFSSSKHKIIDRLVLSLTNKWVLEVAELMGSWLILRDVLTDILGDVLLNVLRNISVNVLRNVLTNVLKNVLTPILKNIQTNLLKNFQNLHTNVLEVHKTWSHSRPQN